MSPKRILLMYISEVSGHHSAAMAIEKALKILEPATQTLSIDAFSYTNPTSERIIHALYMSVIKRFPKIWDYLYDNPKIVKITEKLKEAINRMNASKLKNLFDNFRPDSVVCTQAFPCGMVSGYKKVYNSAIPLIAVLTDYAPHSYWIYDNIDCYISPSDEVAQRLKEKNVAPEKIKCLGIPFDPKFNDPINKNLIFNNLKLNPDIPAILIMGGGHGLGPIEKVVKSLEDIDQNLQEIIVTGNNIKLRRSLVKNIKKYKKRILILGYVDNINELMEISDVIITKPGGVTTAEALAKKLPMIIINPLPGQEAKNTEYLIKQQAAIEVDRPEDIGSIVNGLLQNKAKLKSMSESAAQISKPNSSLDIAKLLLQI